MTRDFREECIEAGRDAMGRNDGWRWWAPRHLYRLFDLWEPMIRADERDVCSQAFSARRDDLLRDVALAARADERERVLSENGRNVILALEAKIATLQEDLDHAWAVANGEARR